MGMSPVGTPCAPVGRRGGRASRTQSTVWAIPNRNPVWEPRDRRGCGHGARHTKAGGALRDPDPQRHGARGGDLRPVRRQRDGPDRRRTARPQLLRHGAGARARPTHHRVAGKPSQARPPSRSRDHEMGVSRTQRERVAIRQQAVLEAYEIYGTVAKACEVARVARSAHYRWLRNRRYAVRFREAEEQRDSSPGDRSPPPGHGRHREAHFLQGAGDRAHPLVQRRTADVSPQSEATGHLPRPRAQWPRTRGIPITPAD